ncbi:hypothetical protein MWH25_03440 [Natroniella acetigena]|uniref:HNH endonuclease domain-containing protein n=1 Tax=Natroniella acetigena TaxID=52004 RepID=UPI00200A501D|nr:HNH endonuclease domain-containing protein [Natroniella acetigena]MCK8826799.1 hypothetical protein [Natroniella acetigena]
MLKLPKQLDLNIQAFENMLQLKRMTNSYKLYWFTALFEEIKEGKEEVHFKQLVLRMIVKSWYSIVEYRLNFGSQDKLGKLVLDIYNYYDLNKNIKETDLLYFLKSQVDDEIIKQGIKHISKFVPYRLLSPFYPELKGVKDYKKNKLIAKLSLKDDRGIYRIEEDKIIVNKNWFDYIYNNQVIIEGWLKYKLIYLLQKRNPNVPAIPFKLAAAQKRNLRKAKKYWNDILEKVSFNDIYTGQEINSEISLSIDHFIPWSFVLHDELWNLVPTFKRVNSKKSDRLPKLDQFLEEFCEVQYKGFKMAMEYGFSKKQMEDYLSLNQNMVLSKDVTKDFFVSSLEETILPLYQIAKNQGFMVLEELVV